MTMNISFKRDCISFCISQTMCVQPEGKTHYKATLIAWMCVLKLPCCEKSNPNKPGSWWSLCTLLRGAQVTLLAGQGGVACDTHCTQGEKIPRKSENWVPQITAWLSLRGLCWFCALTAGGGTSGEFVCYPRAWKKPEKEINPSSPCPCSLGTGSGTDWDPLWLLPRLPLFLNKCLSVLPVSVLLAVSWCQPSCLGPARAAQLCPAQEHHTPSFGLQSSLSGCWS